MSVDAVVDERTLREIYLASFEAAIKKSKPWTVMCSYNRVNGTYVSEHRHLLTEVLKEEWGHEGFVVSDWGAVNNRDDSLASGLELEMPTSGGVGERKIIEAIQSGKLEMDVLDRAVNRLLTVIFRTVDQKREYDSYDKEAHHRLARRAAGECMVLLRNEDQFLPLAKTGRIAVIGALAKRPRYQGGGSSHVNAVRIDDPVEEIRSAAGQRAIVTYAQGYDLDSDMQDDEMLFEAIKAAQWISCTARRRSWSSWSMSAKMVFRRSCIDAAFL